MNIDHGGMEYVRAYEEGLLMTQQAMIIKIINSFLLLKSSAIMMPWNLLDVLSYIIKDGVVFAWVSMILQ